MIYHITHKEAWNEAKKKGFYSIESLEKAGFIHCSSKSQVVPVANRLFKEQKNLVLLCIDENKLKSKVIFEDLHGHGTFPHIYGQINLGAVIDVIDLPHTFAKKP